MITATILTLYVLVPAAFFCGSWWASASAKRAALAEAASLVEDEACRAALHGEDVLAGRLFGVAAELRQGQGTQAWRVEA